ncbi:MAG: tetratricopeptide repeat protein [Bdellovibrionia bacterium]
MSSTTSNSHSVDRKAIKRPDGFLAALHEFFDYVANNANVFLAGVASLLIVGLIVAFFMNRSGARSEVASDALYLAEKTLNTEIKSMADLNKPVAAHATAAKTNAEGVKKAATDEENGRVAEAREKLRYQKMDVDAKLPGAVQKLKEVEQSYTGTRSAFEARVKLGDLYYDHGDYAKGLPWFQKAVDSAPAKLEKALALSSLGYTYENLSQHNEAIQAYQKANSLGQASVKGDLLLGIARCYEALHDSAKARSTYDQILTELPNTEFSKSAELYKNQLL